MGRNERLVIMNLNNHVHSVLTRPASILVVVLLIVLLVVSVQATRKSKKPNWERLTACMVEETRAPLRDYKRFGLVVGGWLRSGCLVLLLASVPWWLRRASYTKCGSKDKSADWQLNLRWFWVLTIVVILFAGWVRYPRLSLGLYSDEIYTLRNFVHGQYKADSLLAEKSFHPVDWDTTWWNYKRSNNHVLFSVVSKQAGELWRMVSGADEAAFSPAVMRLPSLLAALLSLAVLILLLARAGLPRAGLLAAALLAIHPWHVFHSVTVRGYAFVMLFSFLAVWALFEILSRGRGWLWVVFTVSVTLLIATYPAHLYLSALLAGVAGIIFVCRRDWLGVVRLLAAGLASLALLAPLLIAWYPQLNVYLARHSPKGCAVNWQWLLDQVSLQFTGMTWFPWAEQHPLAISTSARLEENWILGLLVLTLLPALTLAGIYLLWSKRRSLLLLLGMFPLAGLIVVIQAQLNDDYLFLWYLAYIMPALFCCIGVALGQFQVEWLGKVAPRFGMPAFAAVVIICFSCWIYPQLRTRLEVAKEPTKEIAQSLAEWKQHTPSAIAALVWHSADIYDPSLITVGKDQEVSQLLQYCQANKLPLRIAVNYRPVHEQRRDQVYQSILSSDDFRLVDRYFGLESANSDYWIYEYNP